MKLLVAQPPLFCTPEMTSVPAPPGEGTRVRGIQSAKLAMRLDVAAGMLNVNEELKLKSAPLTYRNVFPAACVAVSEMAAPEMNDPAGQSALFVGVGGPNVPPPAGCTDRVRGKHWRKLAASEVSDAGMLKDSGFALPDAAPPHCVNVMPPVPLAVTLSDSPLTY
jgi:hypothetical protein